MKPHPPPDYRKRKLTLDEAQREMNQEATALGRTLSQSWLEKWQRFEDQIHPSDEIWYWENVTEPLSGGAGYCLVRDGITVAQITTKRL